jgi:hypothetical protein
MLMSPSAAETPKLSVSEADDACASYFGILVAHREKDAPNLVADWKFKCEHHPVKRTCESTLKIIQQNGLHITLNCGQPVVVLQSPPPRPAKPIEAPRGQPPIDSKVAQADDACASYAGILLAHGEQDDPALVAEWKFKCEHHPLKSTCESTRKFIQQNTPIGALNCVGGDR